MINKNSGNTNNKRFIPTPEFLTHTLISNYLNKDIAKYHLCLPATVEKYFSVTNEITSDFLLPLVEDKESLIDLMKMKQHIKFLPYSKKEKYLYNELLLKFQHRLDFIKGSDLIKMYEFIFELLIYSQIKNYPILMAKSSPSKTKTALDKLNEFLHLFHKPELLRIFDGDKEFGEKIKIYGKTKLKALGLMFTSEGRGALIWSGTFFLLGKCLLKVHSPAFEIGWFVFYDP